MAKIPLTAVPSAPETVRPLLTELPTPDVTYAQPAAPANIKYPAPISVPPVSARMQETTNFEGHIAGLQQREMNAPFGALFAANTAIGQNLMSAGAKIGSEAMDMGFALMKSKDQADISRANNLIQGARGRLQEGHRRQQYPVAPSAVGALGVQMEFRKLTQDIKSIGMSAYSADRVVPKVQSFQSQTRTALLHEGNK